MTRGCSTHGGGGSPDTVVLLAHARAALAGLARRTGLATGAAVEGVVVEVDARSSAERGARRARAALTDLAGEAGLATRAAVGVIGGEVDARSAADHRARHARAALTGLAGEA